jgi:hypothetical protein
VKIDSRQNRIDIGENKENLSFSFDHVFEQNTTQETVFLQIAKNAIDWVCQGYNATIFAYGSTGCLDPDTPVLLFNGKIKKAKDIVIGDILMGDDSTPRVVQKLYSGEDEMYDVIPNRGEKYRVNKSHILTLYYSANPKLVWYKRENKYKVIWNENGKQKSRNFLSRPDAKQFYNTLIKENKIVDIPVQDYISAGKTWQSLYKGIKTSVEYKEKSIPVDAYELAELLCSVSDNIDCLKPYQPLFSRIGGNDYMENNLWKYMTENNLFKNKIIPEVFLINSNKIRLEFLAGIIDTNTQNDNVNYYDIKIGEDIFSENVETLLYSLGFVVSKKRNLNCLRIFGNLEKIPTRKYKKIFISEKRNLLLSSIQVRHVGRGRYNGFYLDGNHRFLLADGTVTHNSGKSHTMFGTQSDKGIIPRTCDYIFKNINNNENVIEANMKCSFLEIYREKIRDLLSREQTEQSESLKIRHSQNNEVYIPGLIEKHVYSPEDILETIGEGAAQRTIASTALNNVSSRSHAVLTLTLQQKINDGSSITSKLHLIDLAGSENVGKSEVQGVNLTEAQTINKSLSCLGNVIYALTEKGREHIPYRDSKLTYLLQDSLGGNSKTILIATLSPSINFISETINTLKFASRAKQIKNIPKINKNEGSQQLLQTIEKLNKRIAELEQQCEDSKIIINAVEQSKEETKEVVLLKTKCERLEKKINFMLTENQKGLERNGEVKELFRKQRELARKVSKELYRERMRNFLISNELEQYKIFHNSILNSSDKPDILPLIINRFKINTETPIDIPEPLDDIEIDSP